MKFRNIKLCEKDRNKKGDLFSRLMSDLFYSLGYKEPRLNIHKSGREIDITSMHRTERKLAVGECKAHEVPIGGDEVNKFIGALDAERKKHKKANGNNSEVVGYFISLSGFKETAIEQENDLGNKRVILVDSQKIVEELIAGKILVSIEKAISCISQKDNNLHIADYADLFATERGWVWVLYYTNGQSVSHFTFVHAEGKPLIKELSDELILLSSKIDKGINKLSYIIPDNIETSHTLDTTLVQEKYFKYLENECGDIQFEGLPTDKDSGSVKVDLESIFVPLHLIELSNKNRNDNTREIIDQNRVGVGDALRTNKKIAILARPGGGKSTLIKRIAIAYAYPERRQLVDDNLPDLELFPIFIRCRELGSLVRSSITEIINSIPVRAELLYLQPNFQLLATSSLQKGSALILIDGLDEISEERDRIIFVNQLRTFLSTYPNLFIIITSREAGFRAVSGVISSYCTHYNLSILSDNEIVDLTLKWHKAIIDDTYKTREDALNLSRLIIKDNKINILARNPLLLTTLLFVKRYVGYLPTKRNILYQEMIKLLLVTWNVEGYEQLDIEETEPQLSYVAFWMTQNGKQSISSEELKICLIAARKQMPDILDYTKISVSDFIKRVESRSSLLIMAGHKQSENGIIPIYEFLHLSFQEYLTAKAIVEKYVPEYENGKNNIEILEPHFLEENWKEVIPLVAVLLKRQSKPLMDYLISKTKTFVLEIKDADDNSHIAPSLYHYVAFPKLLGNCLAYDIQITPETLDESLEWFIKGLNEATEEVDTIKTITNGKFGDKFKNKLKEIYFKDYDLHYSTVHSEELASIIATVGAVSYENMPLTEAFELLIKDVLDTAGEDKFFSILALMQFSFEVSINNTVIPKTNLIEVMLEDFNDLLKSNDSYLSYAVSWALVWLGESGIISENNTINEVLCEELVKKWLFSVNESTSRFATWGLNKLIRPGMNFSNLRFKIKNIRDLVNQRYMTPSSDNEKIVAIYVGTNIGLAWSLEELKKPLKRQDIYSISERSTARIYASHLGLDLNSVEVDIDDID